MWCHCFDPGKDINNIHKRVREDATILSLMEACRGSSDTVAARLSREQMGRFGGEREADLYLFQAILCLPGLYYYRRIIAG